MLKHVVDRTVRTETKFKHISKLASFKTCVCVCINMLAMLAEKNGLSEFVKLETAFKGYV